MHHNDPRPCRQVSGSKENPLKIYMGQTRSAKLIAKLEGLGVGEMTVREEFPPRRPCYALDNGAYRDFTANKPFNVGKFNRVIQSLIGYSTKPDFIVAPDIVAGGLESLRVWLGHVFSLRYLAPVYLAVQNGMRAQDVVPHIHAFQGLFVGGDLEWKIKTGESWVQLAHEYGKLCHIGRVGTAKRIRWAKRIKADSIDSCLPLFSEENFERFWSAFLEEDDLFSASGF